MNIDLLENTKLVNWLESQYMFPKAPRLIKSHDHCHQIRGNFSKSYSFNNNLVIREPNPKYDNKKSQQVQKNTWEPNI